MEYVQIMIPIFLILLSVIIGMLALKIHLLHKSMEEIRLGFQQKLLDDTNTLIGISSRDRHMRRLAADLNGQLALLRSQKLSYRQGNLEITNAITNISHDLRTPLTAICGYLDLAAQTENPQDIRRYLRIIAERADALKQLTEELFSYSAAASALTETPFEEIELESALEEALASCYASLKEKKITPAFSAPGRKVVRILNKNALSRIFNNIIGNAVKYSEGDLTVSLSESGKIRFANRARGLSQLHLMRLFDRFYTVETAAKSTGLGLSIARELTQQMGGTITACCEEETLTITVIFPEQACPPGSLPAEIKKNPSQYSTEKWIL